MAQTHIQNPVTVGDHQIYQCSLKVSSWLRLEQTTQEKHFQS